MFRVFLNASRTDLERIGPSSLGGKRQSSSNYHTEPCSLAVCVCPLQPRHPGRTHHPAIAITQRVAAVLPHFKVHSTPTLTSAPALGPRHATRDGLVAYRASRCCNLSPPDDDDADERATGACVRVRSRKKVEQIRMTYNGVRAACDVSSAV